MMRDDDSRLSAFLDGQLDPVRRQQVESALVSNPRLAEELRRLAAVRDLVAGLPRDSSVDVTRQVMERIRGLPRSRPWFPWMPAGQAGSRPALVAGAMLASAALVVFAVTLALSMTLRIHRPDASVRPALAHSSTSAKSTMATEQSGTKAMITAPETRPDSSPIVVPEAIAASAGGNRSSAPGFRGSVESPSGFSRSRACASIA